MKKTLFVLFLFLFHTSCQICGLAQATADSLNDSLDWTASEWIVYEELEDSMKIVPGVHGWGNRLGNLGKESPVVPLFRKSFDLTSEVERVVLYICGLGHYEATINGARVGDRLLAPGWTLYQKRQLYNEYDVTDLIRKGENVLGVVVGNGFFNINRKRYRKLVIAYGSPRLIYQLVVYKKDGSFQRICSDSTSKVFPSPIVFTSIYGGEDFDARIDVNRWDRPGFDESEWKNAEVLDAAANNLYPENDFPIKVMEEFKPKRIFKSSTGRTIYDFGQNASGIIELKVQGKKGTRICIRPDELLNEDYNVTQNSGGRPYEFNYTLNGESAEHWRPKFTYYGFQYADVEIIETEENRGTTDILELNMLHTRNSAPVAGSFECSDTLLNDICRLINWSIKSNMASVLTDCPHREKLGWLEQSYLMGPSIHFNFDIESFSRKIIQDMMDSQTEHGLVPDIAPEYVVFDDGFRNSPEWGSACILLPWHVYQWYGDFEVLSSGYPMMQRYMDFLKSQETNYQLEFGLGDWYDLGPLKPGESQLTPKAVTATAIYYLDLTTMERIAVLLGKHDDARQYKAHALKVRQAFLNRFYDKESGVCATGSQTAYAISLYTGLIPINDQKRVMNNLINSIESDDFRLTAGDIGYYFLIQVLNKHGRSDIIYEMNSKRDRPGYAHQLLKGRTSLSESWSALSNSSQNHLMLGHLMEWFYSGLGGITQDVGSIAYKDIILAPQIVDGIRYVKSSYLSKQGLIISEWETGESGYRHHFVIPDNSTATIVIPDVYSRSKFRLKSFTDNKNRRIRLKHGKIQIGAGAYDLYSR